MFNNTLKGKSYLVFSLLLITSALLLAEPFLGRSILNRNNEETGLKNMNPDPLGEPWIAGGMRLPTEEQILKMKNAPELEIPRSLRNRILPAQVILINNPEFPPVFNQVGGSCAQASGVAYTYSYQLNVINGTIATDNNTRAYGFTHNFLNDGDNSNGSWYYEGWEILMNHGAPDVATFYGAANGGLNGTRWMSGNEKWHAANDNRAVEYFKIKIESMSDIEKIKSWMYDLNGTDPYKKGGAVVFASNSASATGASTVSSGPFAGERLCLGLTKNGMDHAMTFAGYSDSVEGGALLLLNSWGKDWGTNGHVWVPYSKVVNGGLYNDEVWCVKVEKNIPYFEINASVTHNSRNNLSLRAGFASGSSSIPDSIVDYGMAFNFGGGPYSMAGSGGNSTIEVALNVSHFYNEIINGEVTFFLEVINNGGSCIVNGTKLIDYTGTSPLEILSAMDNVSVPSGDTVLIPISFKPKVKRYYVNAKVSGQGTINPAGKTVVDSGNSINYTMIPDKWYKLDSLIVNGDNKGNDTAYTILKVMSNAEITAYFSWDETTAPICTVTCANALNGYASPKDMSLYETGKSAFISFVPNRFHIVDSVILDGKNLGPLYNVDFKNIKKNHNIVPFFSTKSYGAYFPLWDSSMIYGNGTKDTVQHNGYLWESNWWTKGSEPGNGGEWTNIGSINDLVSDTIKVSHLTYYSDKMERDSLVVVTYLIHKSDTVFSYVESFVDGAVNNKIKLNKLNFEQLSILNDGKKFYAPIQGVYEITLFNLKGRRIYRKNYNVLRPGIVNVPFNRKELSSGLYLMQIQNSQMNVRSKITIR